MADDTDTTENLVNSKDLADSVAKSLSDLRKAIPAINSDVNGLGKNVLNLANDAAAFVKVFTTFSGFDTLKSNSATVGTLSDQFKELNNSIQISGMNLSTFLGKMSGGDTKFIGDIEKIIGTIGGKFLESADAGGVLESKMLNMLATTGDLSQAFKMDNTLLPTIGMTTQFAKVLVATSEATKLNQTQISAYVNGLARIPGIMSAITKSTADGAEQGIAYVDVLRLSAAAGVGADVAANIMTKAYEKVANGQGKVTDHVQKGIDMFALMIETSSKLHLNFSDTEGYLDKVAESFQYIGDNTGAAAKILGQYSEALRNTGLTAPQTTKALGDMLEKVSQLSVGTKAMISQRAGGPGGLQGAFRVDRLMREGKTDEVFEMLRNSMMKQMGGGRLVTREEADTSQAAANKFMKQQQIVKSGAFGAITGGNADLAGRLLDAMASGNIGAGKDIISGKDKSREDALAKGKSIQENQNTFIGELNRTVENTNVLLGPISNALAKKLKPEQSATSSEYIKNAQQTIMSKPKTIENAREDIGKMNVLSLRNIKLNVDAAADAASEAKKSFMDQLPAGFEQAYASKKETDARAKAAQSAAKKQTEDEKRGRPEIFGIQAGDMPASVLGNKVRTTAQSYADAHSRTAGATKPVSFQPIELLINVKSDPGLSVSVEDQTKLGAHTGGTIRVRANAPK